ncbi:MAG: nucleotide-binding protein [Myxococcales bacterium]|nr:nucleotide-binding protein [Myxococcales bacterium]
MTRIRLLPLGVALALAGCVDKKTPEASAEPASSAAPAASYSEVPRPAVGATPITISGTIVEKLSHPMYTYLLLDTGSAKEWAAVPTANVEVGQKVTVEQAMLMQGYHSAALKRDFDRVYFGTLSGAPRPALPSAGASDSATPHATPAPEQPARDIHVKKAPGADGKRVAEVIAQAAKLAGQTVSVRGVVVKAMPAILGKNWIHLQDGSGTAEAKTHDLTVTLPPDQAPKLGETVLVQGKVATDKDLGSGYRFKVLLEAERMQKEK